MQIFAFKESGNDAGSEEACMGVLVYAESVEKATELATDPALVEFGQLDAEGQAKLVFYEVLNGEQQLRAALYDLPIITERALVVARTSLAAMKDDAVKFFKTNEHYIIGAKDRDDALKLIDAVAEGFFMDDTGLRNKLKVGLAEQPTPKEEFERPPRVVTWQAVEWDKARRDEPPMMPMPSMVM